MVLLTVAEGLLGLVVVRCCDLLLWMRLEEEKELSGAEQMIDG